MLSNPDLHMQSVGLKVKFVHNASTVKVWKKLSITGTEFIFYTNQQHLISIISDGHIEQYK